jgi:hypothetical protein
MTQLPISFPELVEAMRACGPIGAGDCTPKHLRSLMVAQLTATEPAIANRIWRFTDDQLRAMCDYILAGVRLAAVPAA